MINEKKVSEFEALKLLKLEIDKLNDRLDEIVVDSNNLSDDYLDVEDINFIPPLINRPGNEKGYLATTLGQYDEVLFVHDDGSKIHGVLSICAFDWIEVIELDQFDAQTDRKFRFDAHYLPPFFKKVYDYGVG